MRTQHAVNPIPSTSRLFDHYVNEFPAIKISIPKEVSSANGWSDISYANDMCPSFWNESLRIKLFIEDNKASKREDESNKRYLLTTTDDEGCQVDDIVCTESKREINRAINMCRLSAKFSEVVRRVFGEEHLAEVNKRNAEYATSKLYNDCCATHEFCDANMLMDEAYRAIFHRGMDVSNMNQTQLVNAAWSRSKANKFQ